MTKTEQIKLIAIAMENENWENGNVEFDFLGDLIHYGLISRDYAEELVDWLEDENLRLIILNDKDNNIVNEMVKILDKIIKHKKENGYGDDEYYRLVNNGVEKIDKIIKEKRLDNISFNNFNINTFKNKKILASKLINFMKENKELL